MPSTPDKLLIPVLSAANFVIGMGAFMVIGALNPVAEDFGIDAGTAGRMLTFYAMGYAVLSPLLVSLTGGIGRRRVLAIGLAVFAAANLAAALATSPDLLFAARVLAAAGAGLITPVAANVAATLAAPGRQARALAAVFYGLTLSQVLGLPAGGWVAYTFGWRAAFGLVALLTLPFVPLIWRLVPPGLSFRPVSLGDLGRTLASPPHLAKLLFTPVFVSASYVLYTYISPLLSTTMGFERDGIILFLTASGLGAVVGNHFGGQITDRIGTFRMLTLLTLVQALTLPCYALLPMPVALLFLLGFTWSAFGWSFNAAQQVRLLSFDPARASVMLAINAGGIYIGAALGSWIGGHVLATGGLLSLGPAASGVALIALAVLVMGEKMAPPPARTASPR